jgi:hypothetical protein
MIDVWAAGLELQQSSELGVQTRAAARLVEAGPAAVAVLAEALFLGNLPTACLAAEALGRIGTYEAAEALFESLIAADGLLRRSVEDALIAIGLVAVPVLTVRLRGAPARVGVAADVLWRIAVRHPAPVLRMALPALRSARFGLVSNTTRRTILDTIRIIQTSTAELGDLPVPGGATVDIENLPLPGKRSGGDGDVGR